MAARSRSLPIFPQVLFFANPSAASGGTSGKRGGIFRLEVPYTVTDPDELSAPTLEVEAGGIQMIVAGGTTDGRADASVLVAINGTALLHRSSRSGGLLIARPLPVRYPDQIVFQYAPSTLACPAPTSLSHPYSRSEAGGFTYAP